MLEETCSLGKAQGKIRDDSDHARILNFIGVGLSILLFLSTTHEIHYEGYSAIHILCCYSR